MATAATANPLKLSPAAQRLAAFVLASSNFMVILDTTVANVSIPHIAGSIGVSLDQGTWVITSYAVSEAISVPLTGWMAQRFGTVRMYLICMTGFAMFSLLCGLSTTLTMIVLCRIGQGLCGGLIMPLAQTLLLSIYPGAQRGKAMLLAATTTMAGPALGPTVGGFISDNFSWHWIFFINIPVGAMIIVSAYAMLRPAETQTRKVPIDTIGLALMIFWIACLQMVLDLGRDRDWFADPIILTLAIFAVIGFFAFLIWELTEEHPIVNLRVFRHGGFTFGVLALALCFGAYFASIVVIPQWLQTSLGYPATLAGFITGCTAMAALVTSRLSAKFLSFTDPRLMVSFGVAWIGVMALVRANWTSDADFWTLALPQIVQGLGMSFFMLPLTTISLGSVPQSELASASGLQNFVRTVVIGISSALALTFWGNAQQEAQSEIASKLQPDATLRTLSDAGFTEMQSTGIIANIAQRESITMAVDYIFLITAAVFFIGALVIWFAPRPKGGLGGIGR